MPSSLDTILPKEYTTALQGIYNSAPRNIPSLNTILLPSLDTILPKEFHAPIPGVGLGYRSFSAPRNIQQAGGAHRDRKSALSQTYSGMPVCREPRGRK